MIRRSGRAPAAALVLVLLVSSFVESPLPIPAAVAAAAAVANAPAAVAVAPAPTAPRDSAPRAWPAVPGQTAIGAAIDAAASGALPPGYPTLHGTPTVPAVLLKAIAWIESQWHQYRGAGATMASSNGGYGVMQVTSPMEDGGVAPTIQSAIANNYVYNIAYGAQMLTDKWLATPIIGDGDPQVLENWYYAVWAFNGWGWSNDPNNPAFTRTGTPETNPSAFPYQERVYYFVAHPPRGSNGRPLWAPVPVTPPDARTIQAAAAGPLPPLATPHRAPPASPGPLLPCPTPTPNVGQPPPLECAPWADRATFETDLDLPDDTTVSPGQPLVKGWLLRNTGGTFWNSAAAGTGGYHLQRLTGPPPPGSTGGLRGEPAGSQEEAQGGAFGGVTRVDVPEVPPLAALAVYAKMTAPLTPGVHTSYWQMQDSHGHPFGAVIWARVMVADGSSGTATPAPTAAMSPTATAAPRVRATSVPRLSHVEALRLKANDSLYVADLSVPDGTVIAPGHTFVKGWLMRNVGTETWNASFHLTFEAGTLMGPHMSVRSPVVPPGAVGAFRVSLVAPTKPGFYRGIWQMTDASGRPFGKQIWVAINVGTPPTATPTPRAAPTTAPGASPSPPSPTGPLSTSTPATPPSPTPPARPSPTATPRPTSSPGAPPGSLSPISWLGPVVTTDYFAEGYTGGHTHEYLSLFNPASHAAGVRLTLYRADGASMTAFLSIPPFAIQTLDVATLAPRSSVSLRIEADRFIAVERSMYVGTGGHVAAAVTQPARHWTFTPWLIGDGYQEWLPLFNPGDEMAEVSVVITPTEGSPRTFRVSVSPHTRRTVRLARFLPRGFTRAISVDASRPLVAEHVAYFNGGRTVVAHSGTTAPSPTWYFADSRTDGGNMAYVPVFNPENTSITVTLTLLKNDGTWLEQYVVMPPKGTHVFALQHIARSPGVSVIVRATAPVYSEESTYLPGRRGAVITQGASHAERTWYLAEGYTGSGFSESIVIVNPGDQVATVRVHYVTRAEHSLVSRVRVPGRARIAWTVTEPLLRGNVAAAFSADRPVVVGRTETFGDGRGITTGGGIWGPAAP